MIFYHFQKNCFITAGFNNAAYKNKFLLTKFFYLQRVVIENVQAGMSAKISQGDQRSHAFPLANPTGVTGMDSKVKLTQFQTITATTGLKMIVIKKSDSANLPDFLILSEAGF